MRALARCTSCDRLWPPRAWPSGELAAAGCAEHPGRPAPWACESCGGTWCDSCASQVRTPTYGAHFSPCCRASCLPVAPIVGVRPFWLEAASVLRYAVRGESLFVLAFLWFAGYVPILSWFVVPLLVVYGFHVLRTSSRDPERAPGFPDPEDAITGLIYPLARFLGAALLAWAPLLLYWRLVQGEPWAPISLALSLLGLALLPAFVLPAAMGASLAQTLDPSRVARTIRAMGADYFAVVAMLLFVAVVWSGTRRLLALGEAWVHLTEPLRIYLVLTAFHVLGRAILQTRDRIEWQV